MKYYVTNQSTKLDERECQGVYHPDEEHALIKIYPDIKEQQIIGFGGAFTEASAYVFSKMSSQTKEKVLELYFGEDGSKYNFGRLHIQSCDFSLGNRAYVDEGDKELETFTIKGDYAYQIPFVKEALKKNKKIQFLASPWSPPAFMKTNNDMNNGGKLEEKYYLAWARMITKYLLTYREEGICIKRITVQNEPKAVQIWDSCVFTAEEESIFAVKFLRTELIKAGLLDIKILIWDHNKERIIERTEDAFDIEGAQRAIDGIGFHWYSGDHFEGVEYIHRKYPDKELIFTEGCIEYSRYKDVGQIENAERYGHDIIGNLKAGMNGFLDWNIILDKKGGPNHVGNFCDAPIMYDIENDTIDIKLSYYYISHFSRFVDSGAKRILTSSYHQGLESVSFENPDGGKRVIVMNTTDKQLPLEIWMDRQGYKINLEAHAIMTACMDQM